MSDGRPPNRPPWWQLPWREIVSCTTGAFILLWQTVLEDQAQALLVGAGLALIGVTGTGAIQRAVRRVTDKEP